MTADGPLELAREFLASAGREAYDPWPEAFASWAQARRLSPALERDVRITVLRLRNFGPGLQRRPRRAKRRA